MSIYSKVMVPVAPGFGDEAQHAVDVARSMLAPGGRLTVISVFEDPPHYLMATEPLLSDSSLEGSRASVRKTVVDTFEAEDVDVFFKRGHPTRAILDLAKDEGNDCIVIASARPGWQTFFLGSTASGVVRHATCSVHVLRDPAAGHVS